MNEPKPPRDISHLLRPTQNPFIKIDLLDKISDFEGKNVYELLAELKKEAKNKEIPLENFKISYSSSHYDEDISVELVFEREDYSKETLEENIEFNKKLQEQYTQECAEYRKELTIYRVAEAKWTEYFEQRKYFEEHPLEATDKNPRWHHFKRLERYVTTMVFRDEQKDR